jgi:hypothetical protein
VTTTVVARAVPGPVAAAWPLRVAAAGGLAVAAGAHFAAFPAHRGEGVVTAGFFIVVAVTQLATALAVARGWSAAIRHGVVAGNLSVAEAVGLLDLAAAGAQVVAVAAVVMLPRTWTRHAILGPRIAVLAVAAVVAVGGAGLVPSAHADHAHDADRASSVTVDAPATIATDGAPDAAGVVPSADIAPVETPSSPRKSTTAGEPDAGQSHDSGHAHAEPHTHP